VSGYCPDHAEAARVAQQQRYDRSRKSAAGRGYGWRWRTRTRPRILRRDPICTCAEAACSVCHGRGCHAASTDVDHIVAREDGGADGDYNLHGLCHDCHSWKTATKDGGLRGKRTPFAIATD
jgi:5-methylcytosine-specific restriction protein A